METNDTRSYPKERRNTVNRLNKRGEIVGALDIRSSQSDADGIHSLMTAAYDYKTVHGIVNTASVLHVSFLPPSTSGTYDDPEERMPIILPMIGKLGVYPDGSDDAPVCYLHGKVANHHSAGPSL